MQTMNKSTTPVIVGAAFVLLAFVVWLTVFRGYGEPVKVPPSASSSSVASLAASSAPARAGENTTGLPLNVPDGWSIDTLADVPGARVIAKDGFGNYWVSQPSRGTVTHVEMSGSIVGNVSTPLRGLNKPHGLAIGPEQGGFTLYVAEEDKISKVILYSDASITKIADLPAGGGHTTRTLGFGPDGRLYVSVGSTCNVCDEDDERVAAIHSMERDGTDMRIEATGLRNAVFFRWHENGDLYATEMGRDQLGDTTPPEEVNIVTRGAHYGWPYCYADRVRDVTYRPDVAFDCASTVSPLVQLPAHIAPLGLDFLPDGDLLVAEHGSWNSSVKVGYKIVRVPLDAAGKPDGEPVDFLTGFLQGNTVHGRPVDVFMQEDGSVLVTDDKKGAVYRMRPL